MTFEFQPILAEKGLSLSLQFTPDVILACDPEKLERVFDNLLRNAVNYSNPNTPIGVTMLKEKDTVIVSVENQGRTIPQDKLDQIFEQFFGWIPLVPVLPAALAWGLPLPRRS